jgi:hypothetical protein
MFFLFRFPPASLPEDLQANSVNPVLEPWDEVEVTQSTNKIKR